jgi:hypothetical protein
LCQWRLLSEAPIPARSGTAGDWPGDGRDPPGGSGPAGAAVSFPPADKESPSAPSGTDVLALSHRPLPRIKGADGILRAAWANTAPWASPTSPPHGLAPPPDRPKSHSLTSLPPRQAARDRSDQALKRRLEMVARDSPLWPALPGMRELDHPAPSPAICSPDAQYLRWFRAAVDTTRSFRIVMAPRGAGSGELTTS